MAISWLYWGFSIHVLAWLDSFWLTPSAPRGRFLHLHYNKKGLSAVSQTYTTHTHFNSILHDTHPWPLTPKNLIARCPDFVDGPSQARISAFKPVMELQINAAWFLTRHGQKCQWKKAIRHTVRTRKAIVEAASLPLPRVLPTLSIFIPASLKFWGHTDNDTFLWWQSEKAMPLNVVCISSARSLCPLKMSCVWVCFFHVVRK